MTEAASWVGLSAYETCPVCGHSGWCRISPDGAVVACRRDRSAKEVVYSDGSSAWLHYLDEPDPTKRGGDQSARVELSAADVDLRDRVYTALLANLGLNDAHAAALQARGLGPDLIAAAGYASLPYTAEDFRVQRLLRDFTSAELSHVPGLRLVERATATTEKYNAERLVLSHESGTLVPVRNVAGKIVALKVRRDHDEPRYVYLSSGEPPAGSHLHMPWLVPTPDDAIVRVTEGELKADVATALSGVLTLSVPGVLSWRLALPAVAALGASTVLVAFDGDKATNEQVARAERSLVAALLELGCKVIVEEWDPEHKGIDDALLAGAEVRRVEQLLQDTVEIDEGQPASSQLVELALRRYDLGVTTRSSVFAVPKVGPQWARPFGPTSNGPLQAELKKLYYRATGKTASSTAITDAMGALEGFALEGEPVDPPLRLARHEDGICVDLGDQEGRAILIRPGAWEVVDRSPVLFRRTNISMAMPLPVGGGDLAELRTILNVDDASWPLLVGWLVSSLFPDISHTVGLLQGPQGSAKTTAGTMLTMLVDPTAAPARAQPETETDWAAIGRSSYVVTLDNVSRIPAWFSDALCRASTGDAYTPRAYYQQEDVTVLAFRLAVLMTSIDAGSMRGDLADRLLPIDLLPIDDAHRRRESDVWAKYQEMRARVYGALLDLTAAVLAELPNVRLDAMPRMADFAFILAAVDRVTGMRAYDTYMASRVEVAANVVEGDPIAMFIRNLVLDSHGAPKNGGRWEGAASDLLALLRRHAQAGDIEYTSIPRTERGISGALARSAPALQRLGIVVTNLGRRREGGAPLTRYEIALADAAAAPSVSHAEDEAPY